MRDTFEFDQTYKQKESKMQVTRKISLTATWLPQGHLCQGGSLTNLTLITAFDS